MHLFAQRHDAEAAGVSASSGPSTPDQVRRAIHFVPGANERLLHKSIATEADSLVLDLEDAVTPENKDSARQTICDWLVNVDFEGKERVVRHNPLDTPWGRDDFEATMAISNPPNAYLVPKVRGPEDIEAIDRLLTELERTHGHTVGDVKLIIVATETPEGVLRIRETAKAPRVVGMTWGAEDLSASIGARRNRDADGNYLDVFQYAGIVCLLACTAAGVQAIGSVFVDIADHDHLRRECDEDAAKGFTGKITIHPDQIPFVNEAFTPNAEEIADAQALLDAFEENQAEGRMVFAWKGEMVDVPHLTRARRILDVARKVGAV